MIRKKIVQFEQNAEFYYELYNKYVQKGNLVKALRYIEKAATKKPTDGFIQFNYAGILAELGEVNKSTDILLNIVENIDSDYSECYFGLGCNYLQLQKVKKAIVYFRAYLKLEPKGEFSDEAEDLLEMLTMIKDANNNLDDDEIEKIYKIEEEAIVHLENREYSIAVEKFDYVVETLPNAVPARNNLSLTYYYMGNIEKAMELAEEVLKYEPLNIHANCNLAVFYNKLNLKSSVKKQTKLIQTLNTENPEYLYKIADTFGSLGKHLQAYINYKKLISIEEENPSYIHYTAVAAFNSKKYLDSIKLWEKLKIVDKDNFLSDFYIENCKDIMNESRNFKELVYIYQLPQDEMSNRIDMLYKLMDLKDNELNSHLKHHPEARELLYFGIKFDNGVLRKLIYNKIKIECIDSAEDILKRILVQDNIEDSAKIETVFLLDIIKASKPYYINIYKAYKTINKDVIEELFIDENKLWKKVRDITIDSMNQYYEGEHLHSVDSVWYEFIKYAYPDALNIKKIDVWAGALEYTVCRINKIKMTQAVIAKKYSISISGLAEKSKLIFHFLNKKAKEPD